MQSALVAKTAEAERQIEGAAPGFLQAVQRSSMSMNAAAWAQTAASYGGGAAEQVGRSRGRHVCGARDR